MRLPLRTVAFFALALSTSSLVACAMGATSLTPPPQKDGGVDAAKDVATTDAAKTDAKLDPPDADVPETIVPQCTLQQSFGDLTCDNCMQKSCCAETNGCLGDSQCMNFLSCLSGCVDGDGGLDQTCANGCASSNPTGANRYMDMTSCGDSFCRNECFAQ